MSVTAQLDGWRSGLCYYPIKVKSSHATRSRSVRHKESTQRNQHTIFLFWINSIIGLLPSIFPALTQFRPSPGSVRATFGWPSKVIQRILIRVWSASKGGQRRPNLCKISVSPSCASFPSRLTPDESQLYLPLLGLRESDAKAAILHNSDTVMWHIYPLHRIPIFNMK